MNHHILDPHINPLVGFVTAGLSTATIWLAETVSQVSPVSKGWIEIGGTVGLIGGLSYGCVTLWKEIQRMNKDARDEREAHREEVAALNEEIRREKRDQNDKLIEVLNKLDPDHR
jgi:hypothetical protein